MIIEYLRYTIPADKQSEFIRAYQQASIPLTRSPYCDHYDLCQCVEDQSQFIIRIRWTSADDHLNRFRGSDDFREFFAYIKDYIKNIEEMRHYELQGEKDGSIG